MYFFAGIFPVLSNLKHIPELENYITESFNNLKFIYMALLIIAPVVSASIMMGYLHRESKALMLHALPMSKEPPVQFILSERMDTVSDTGGADCAALLRHSSEYRDHTA